MDIEQLKKFMKNKIESDNLSKKVRDRIKEVQWEKQDAREGFTESFKPLIESQEKVSEEINKQKQETLEQLKANQESMNKNQLALTSGIKQLALAYGAEGEDKGEDEDEDEFKDAKEKLDEYKNPKIINYDIQKNFTEEEIQNLVKMSYKKPMDILNLNNEDLEEILLDTKNQIQSFNGQIASLSKNKEKNKEKIFMKKKLQKTLTKYRDVVKDLYNSNKYKVGTGIFSNNPNQLFNRLELLIGSINAGNDGVIPEFLNIIHILNKNKLINNNKLNSLINNISLNSG